MSEVGLDAAEKAKRPAKYPGPRCYSHNQKVKRERRYVAHDKYLRATYNITAKLYWEIYEKQGGKCWWCERATGKTKKLAVDHDHECCPTTPTCGRCVRGLLCGTCNKTLGHFRDDPETIERGAAYLRNPPAHSVIASYFAGCTPNEGE